ncbi:MAG: glycosyltransferase family 2 protein [Planctomycetes bacterium]|nr:glycosyltransferase family 2 protein [Planctomycetota bacterium]
MHHPCPVPALIVPVWSYYVAVVFVLSVAVPLYTYFLYPAVLVVFNGILKKKPAPVDGAPLPSVTMVLAAFNEESVIAAKVDNFLQIDYPPDLLRLVIGSDGSSDRTVSLARGASPGNTRIIVHDFPERRGKVNVFNDIVPQLDSDVVVMSDANTMYDPGAVKKLVGRFSSTGVGAVCGRLVLTASGGDSSSEEGLYWRYENFLKRLEGDLGALSSVNGQVFAFRRELFSPLPADAITEDQYLGISIMSGGRRILYEHEAVVSEPLGTLDTERRRRLRISTGNYQAFFRAGYRLLNPMLGFPAFAYFSHKVLRWTVPLMMPAALLSNLALVRLPAMPWLLAAQGVFYAAAILAALFPDVRKLVPFRIVHYFVVMNLTMGLGLLNYFFKPQSSAWQPTERRSADDRES